MSRDPSEKRPNGAPGDTTPHLPGTGRIRGIPDGDATARLKPSLGETILGNTHHTAPDGGAGYREQRMPYAESVRPTTIPAAPCAAFPVMTSLGPIRARRRSRTFEMPAAAH